jgi:hypothetical protein
MADPGLARPNLALFLEQSISKSHNQMECVDDDKRCRIDRIPGGGLQETGTGRLGKRPMQFVVSVVTIN